EMSVRIHLSLDNSQCTHRRRPMNAGGDALIQVSDFFKAYRGAVAVEDLSFDVRPGQIMGLLGPNGAGKTTTMRAITGIIPPTRGRLLVAGHDVSIDPVAAKRMLAYVPDEPRMFDALTVWEHLQFIASAYQLRDFQADAMALLEQFELVGKRDALIQELSRGMRQKVAICCAYLHRPRAILFDEPVTGLDPHGIRTMKESVRQRAAGGAAIIVSSHLLSLIGDLCTHLLILHHGRRIFFGGVEEARTTFANVSGDASLEEMFFRATANDRSAARDAA
ncbi:MAG TPA: ABC transporter ATP-binding protein, partial [Tepidisphaeraceae bacterium]|nr:ABC transporter ATP-binding protein [Tepidisphaeraceae bacterium]